MTWNAFIASEIDVIKKMAVACTEKKII